MQPLPFVFFRSSKEAAAQLYTLPDGHNAPFRKMIAHPKVVQRLNMMLGPGYQEAFEPMGCCYIPGTCGGSLHAGPRGGMAGNEGPLETGLSGTALGYGLANGRAYCEGVNVQWALGDATAAEGGCFVSLRPACLSVCLPACHGPLLASGLHPGRP